MATNINTLKNWFKTNLKPTQAQFWAWLDSYWHKDDQIPITQIENINTILNDKADAQALTNHLTDANAHDTEFGNKVDKDGAKVLTDVNFSQEDKDKLYALGNKQKAILVSRAIISTDNNNTIWLESSTPITITIDDVLPENGEVSFINKGLGIVTFLQGTTDLYAPDGFDLEQFKVCSIIRYGATTNYWLKGEMV